MSTLKTPELPVLDPQLPQLVAGEEQPPRHQLPAEQEGVGLTPAAA